MRRFHSVFTHSALVSPAKKIRKSSSAAEVNENAHVVTKELVLPKSEVTECVVIDDDDFVDDAHDFDHDFHSNAAREIGHDMIYSNDLAIPSTHQPLQIANIPSQTGFFDALSEPHLEEQKLEAILKIENPWTAYDKRNIEYKLWMSVLYSAGKNMAFSCPYADRSRKNQLVQTYFSERCEQFMHRCGKMIVDKEHRPEIPPTEHDALKIQSVAGFVKHSIRHGYTQGCKELDRTGS